MSNILNLIWENEEGHSYPIGELSHKDGKYYFQYNEKEVKKAQSGGFDLLPGFPKANVKYFKEELFTTFEKWIGDKGIREENLIENLKEVSMNGFRFSKEGL